MALYIISPGEKIIKIYRRSKLALLPILSVTALLLIVPLVYFGKYTLPSLVEKLLKFWIFFWSIWFLWHLIRWWSERYIITNQRLLVITHHKPLEKIAEETPLERILNLSVEKKGFLEMLSGLGTVLVSAVGLEKPLELRQLHKPAEISQYLWKEHKRLLANNKEEDIPDGFKRQVREQNFN